MVQPSIISCGWVGGSVEDTALVVGGSDSNVTGISPAWSPGVLDEDEVLSVKGSVSDGEDTVIELGSASGGDDTGSVRLEGHLIGFDGNRDWSVGKGGFHLGGGSLLDIVESGDGTNTGGFLIVARSNSSSSGSVWVGGLELEWSGFDVLESVVHESTIASRVLLGAGDELLLREGFKGSSLDGISSFNGTGGGEGPA